MVARWVEPRVVCWADRRVARLAGQRADSSVLKKAVRWVDSRAVYWADRRAE